MNAVVKILKDDDGLAYPNSYWHLIDPCNKLGKSTLCTKEFFTPGESSVEYENKMGKITCPRCIEMIKTYHKIKL